MDVLHQFLVRAGWKPRASNVWASRTGRYRVHTEDAPASWERTLAPFLAKAILHARTGTAPDVEAIAAVEVKRATPLTDERLERFVAEVAPGQSWILFDKEGRVFPHVAKEPGLRKVAAEQPIASVSAPTTRKRASLFTDLNQWMLKVLLAPQLPVTLLSAPRTPIRNATTLASVADVSPAAAARFVQALSAEDQLDTRFGDLRIARPLDLLKQWRDRLGESSTHPAAVDAGFVRGPMDLRVLADVAKVSAQARREHPPLVLRMHTACAELGFGHVSGPTPMAWVPSFEPKTLEPLGLVAMSNARVDVVLSVPRYPESLYRAMLATGVPTSDIIQCWLDCSHYRLRGQEQADFLWRRVLQPAFKS
ncbi:MAG: hypothetical protein Q8L14_02520 [Myxococcales bacterium]|nr:hypothetical protein [Myxococcales bacterium]